MFSHVKVDGITTQNNCMVGHVAADAREGRKALAVYAPSVEDYIKHITTAYATPQRDGASSRKGTDGNFYKFDSFETAVEIFTKRPHECVSFNPLDIDLLQENVEGNDVRWDVTGDFLDVSTFLSGEPEHFGHNVMGNPRSVFASINVDMLQSCMVDREVMLRQSVRVQALADWLEGQNIRTQIMAFGLNSNFYSEIVIKAFEDYLNVNNLAVATHSDFFRRVMFRQMEYSPTWTCGYGSGITNTKPEVNGITITTLNNPRSIKQIDDYFDDAQKKITEAIENGETSCYVTD